FSATGQATFAYEQYAPTDTWRRVFGAYALFSPGPDRDWDFQILTIYMGARMFPEDPADFAHRHLFDPTNGASSDGDIVRAAPDAPLVQ
ncbi:MAG: hypothetical protein JW706_07240, partial [Opitutales bacterium]|nr:hypothetical protein [Opitutales bacterium]